MKEEIEEEEKLRMLFTVKIAVKKLKEINGSLKTGGSFAKTVK